MIHNLKIERCYLQAIIEGIKTFEVRKNDRNFRKGDLINFQLNQENDPEFTVFNPLYYNIPMFEINYILSDFEGLAPEYVCFSISPVKK